MSAPHLLLGGTHIWIIPRTQKHFDPLCAGFESEKMWYLLWEILFNIYFAIHMFGSLS